VYHTQKEGAPKKPNRLHITVLHAVIIMIIPFYGRGRREQTKRAQYDGPNDPYPVLLHDKLDLSLREFFL